MIPAGDDVGPLVPRLCVVKLVPIDAFDFVAVFVCVGFCGVLPVWGLDPVDTCADCTDAVDDGGDVFDDTCDGCCDEEWTALPVDEKAANDIFQE